MKILVFDFFLKGKILKPFFRPSALKTEIWFQQILRVGYVYREKSFDTIFILGYGVGAYSAL